MQTKAVQCTKTFKRFTPQQYQSLLSQLGLSPGGRSPDGALFHIAVQSQDGIGMIITEIWQSREQLDRHLRDQVDPAIAQLGLPEPKVDVAPVYSFMTTGQLAQADEVQKVFASA